MSSNVFFRHASTPIVDPPKLPDHEYKFGEGDWVATNDEVEAAFWWEYLREGNEKNQLRKKPGLTKDEESGLSVGFRWYVAQYFAEHALLDYTQRIAWRELSGNMRGMLSSQFPIISIPAFVNNPPFSVSPVYKKKVDFSRLRVWVDWQFSDRQIAKTIERELAWVRPGERPARARNARKLSGESILAHPLCPDFRAALVWLGWLRCKNACKGDLEAMVRFYCPDGEVDVESLRKEAMWARRVIKWLTTGDSIHLLKLPKAKTRKRRKPRTAACWRVASI